MKIQEIVEKWLIDNGYEGLSGEDCGCEVGDLMPCDEPGNCEAGHKIPCPGQEDCVNGGGCPWHMAKGKG